jgi:hypothetical protein
VPILAEFYREKGMIIVKQFFKEFWLPLILGVIWALYSTLGSHGEGWSTVRFINTLFGTLFLISWFTGQYFRIRKQTQVENNFQSIEKRINLLLQNLEEKTENLVGHLTGGESFCYLMLSMGKSNSGKVVIIHQGKHALYDITARIVDIDLFGKTENDITFEAILKNEIHRRYNNLFPGHCNFNVHDEFNLGDNDQRRFNIFWTARNGDFTQMLRFIKIEDQWYYATKILRDDKILFQKIEEKFPKNTKGEIDW